MSPIKVSSASPDCADGFGISALLGAQLGFEQQARHAEHAVHRRADLVAHRGEEAGFGTAGGLRLVARFRQGVFERFAFGDVAPDALDFHRTAAMIAYRVIFPGDPAPAIGRAHMLVVANAGAARFQAGEAAEYGLRGCRDEAPARKAGQWRVRA